MESEKFDRLITSAGRDLSALGPLIEKAEHFIAEQMEAMKERGEAVELSDDELRLVKAYQSFKARSPGGSVFSWQTPPSENEIVLPPIPSLLVDPREVSR